MKMAILIDSNVWCAYANVNDVHHKNAKKIIEDIVAKKYGKGIITDYIFDEVMSVTLRKSDKETAKEIGRTLLNSEIIVARVDTIVFQKAWNLFQTTEGLSFTDCTSLAFMLLFEIKKIATFDKGFKQSKEIEVVAE